MRDGLWLGMLVGAMVGGPPGASLVAQGDLLAPRGGVWKYDDTGTDLGTAWSEASYDDAGWAEGPAELGYGDGDEATGLSYGPDQNAKYVTYYFRMTFDVEDPAAYEDLTLRVLRDDGCVVYLNGAEVVRSQMPAGEINYSTFASAIADPTDEAAWHEYTVASSALVAGQNVVAIEVHQGSLTSSDVSMDFELEGKLPPPPVPQVFLLSPANYEETNSTAVDFACAATDAVGLQDATLYVGSTPTTVTLGGAQDSEDAEIRATTPDDNFGSLTSMNVDGENPHAHALIRFPGLFGAGPGQVPAGSWVESAVLEVNCTNPGNVMQVYRLTQDWTEDAVTWNEAAAGVPWANPGADGEGSTSGVALDGDCTTAGRKAIDITQFVRDWSAGDPNFGVVLTDTGTDGVDFPSSESADPPVLTVTFGDSSWQAVETKPLGGTSDTATFTTALPGDGEYHWNCLVTNTSGEQAWAPSDFAVTVDANVPDAPRLVAPADGATGEPLSVLLEAVVGDPNGDPLRVTFHGRPRTSTAEEFTIIALPDTQKYSASYPAIFTAQTQWIVDNAIARNIVFVTHEGDVVDTYDNTTQWERADASMSLLDGVVPYGMCPGNHDEPTTLYNQYFPYTRYSTQPWFGGSYNGKNDDNYQLFSAGGADFIVLHLDFCPTLDVLSWADTVLKSHADRQAILTTHGFIDSAGNRNVHQCTDTQYIWDNLIAPNENVGLVLCGHFDGEYTRTDTVGSRTVHQLLADYQWYPEGGEGWLRILRFVPAENKIHVETYSPWLDQYQIDADSEFTLDYPIEEFSLIAEETGVPSGSSVTAVWSDLEPDAEYEWIVTVEDTTGKTRAGPLWTFTTGSGDVDPPVLSVPQVVDITDTQARITWSSDEPADSLIDYGEDANYGLQSFDGALVTSHSVVLGGLTPETLYYYHVTSEDASGNQAVSGGYTFTTAASNVPPTADDQSVATEEDTAVLITLTASDPNGDPVTYTVTSGPADGALSGTPPDVTYTPAGDFHGVDSFTFVANDGTEDSPVATVSITITAVNDPPVAQDLSMIAEEDVPEPITLAVTDVDGDSLTYHVVTPPANGSLSGTAPDLVYTPAPGYIGVDSFSYRANDGTADSNVASVDITVHEVNEAPVAEDGAVVTDEDTVAAVTLVAADADGDPLTYQVLSGPTNGVLSGTAPSFLYTPAENFTGTDDLTFQASDGMELSNVAAVRITVTPVNDSPVADPQSVGTLEDTAVAVTLTASDVDGDSLGYQVLSGPTNGALSGVAPGLTYTPAADYSGPDSFVFEAADGQGGADTATVSISVTAVNDPPVAEDETLTTSEDAAVAVTLSATDVDGDLLSYVVTSGPSHGTLSGTAPNLTYTPAADYNGADSFTFDAGDGQGGADAGTISILVTPVNDPPAPPQNLTGTPGNGLAALDWDDNTEPEGDLSGYNVFRSVVSGAYDLGSPLASTVSSSYTDDTAANETTYFYIVTAVDGDGLESVPSAEVQVRPGLATIEALATEDPVVTYGIVEGDGIAGTTASGDGLVQTITESPDGGAGASSLLAEYVLRTPAPPTAVTAFTLFVEATWTDGDAGDPLVVRVWNGSSWENISGQIQLGAFVPATGPEDYVDSSGQVRVQFQDTDAVRKETKDTVTIDLLRAEITAGPPDTDPPLPPTGLAAAGADLDVRLSWNPNGEADLSGYLVYRSVSQGGTFDPLTPLPIAQSSYVDPVGSEGTFYYVVTALDQSANESGFSQEAEVTLVDVAPAPPTDLDAQPRDGAVQLTWSPGSESDLDGYLVYRAETAGGPYVALTATATPSAIFDDTGVQNGTTYYYVVSAVDLGGHESGYSAEANATPEAGATVAVHVAGIDLALAPTGKNTKALATVVVVDAGGTPQVGAAVVGDWSLDGEVIAVGTTGLTDGSGVASVSSTPEKARSGDEFTFSVTDITLGGAAYDAAQNIETTDSIVVP